MQHQHQPTIGYYPGQGLYLNADLQLNPAVLQEPGFDLANASHSQATVVMEIANAMVTHAYRLWVTSAQVQHNPRDALALYIKCLQLFKNVISDPVGHSQHLIEAKVRKLAFK